MFLGKIMTCRIKERVNEGFRETLGKLGPNSGFESPIYLDFNEDQASCNSRMMIWKMGCLQELPLYRIMMTLQDKKIVILEWL